MFFSETDVEAKIKAMRYDVYGALFVITCGSFYSGYGKFKTNFALCTAFMDIVLLIEQN
jgi:hypothetical protein